MCLADATCQPRLLIVAPAADGGKCYPAVGRSAGCPVAARAAAAASLCLACQGGPIDRPIAERKARTSSRPSTAAASRNTRSRSYQCTDQPRASAAVEALARAARGGRSYAFDERHGVSERKHLRSREVQVTAHRP